MGELLTGTVKFFKIEKDKRYGFIVRDGQPDLFFHFKAGRNFVQAEEGTGAIWADSRVARDPQPGDRLVFEIDELSPGKRPRAKPWGFETDKLAIEQRVADRRAA